MHVQAAHPSHFAWLQARTGCALTPAARALEAVRADGSIAGMLVYDLWTRGSATLHVAVDAPMAVRALRRPAFAYPFQQAGVRVLLATIAAGNARSLALVRGLGFRETHRTRDGAAPGEDALHFEMHRDDCRWL